MELLTIDGSAGEGGGQVLRSALSLAVALARPVRVVKVRAGRGKPGLLRQHLTALRAAAKISGGELEGDELGSTDVVLRPGAVRPGTYEFGIGSAGSTLLVLQTVLPPLFLAGAPSTIVLEGGTHNPMAPPFEFLRDVFAPRLAELGVGLVLELQRPGFHPAGGGRVRAVVTPAERPRPLELLERGPARSRRVEIGLAHLPREIADREWAVVSRVLGAPDLERVDLDLASSAGPGNHVSVRLEHEHVTEILTAFGERRVSAERVAQRVADEARRYLQADAPVGEHLADQLMLPLALLAGGRFRTLSPSLHARTNADVVNRFLPGAVQIVERGAEDALFEVRGLREATR